MCDDYNHDGTPDHDGIPGDTWLANLTNPGTGSLTNLRFASFGLTAYEEVGWLLLQTEVQPRSQWAAMNYAVWYIFFPDPTLLAYPNAKHWYDEAITASHYGFYGANFSKVEIATPVGINAPPTGDQEFIFLNSGPHPPVSPETGSFALLGTGLAAIAGTMHKKFRK